MTKLPLPVIIIVVVVRVTSLTGRGSLAATPLRKEARVMRIHVGKRLEGVSRVIMVPGRRTHMPLVQLKTVSKPDLRGQASPLIIAIDSAERLSRSGPA